MKKNKIVLLLLLIGSPLFATFNNIQDGDDILASPIMQNFRHVNYGSVLKPVDSAGNNNDDTLDLGTNTVRWKNFYYSSQIFSPDGSAATPSITNLNDEDTGIFYPADNSIGFSTSGSEAFRVDSNGHLEFDTSTLYIDASNNKVGVGTNTPSTKFDVNGTFTSRSTISILRDVGNSNFLVSGGNASNSGANVALFGGTHATNANKVRFRAGGTETIWIDASGNIGVGISSPDSHIHIRKSEVPVLKLDYSGLRAYSLSVTGALESDGLSFTDASGGTELVRIRRDGDFRNYTGDIVAEAGDIVAEAGDIVAEAGDIVAVTGDIVAESGYGSFSDGIIAGGTTPLKMKVLDIGDWNMDTTLFAYIYHGIGDYSKIRQVSVLIKDDGDTYSYPLDYPFSGSLQHGQGGGIANIDDSRILLTRLTGEFFDSINFDSTSYNRGWVTIWYE